MSRLNIFKLFDNTTRSQISWNLIVYKELSAGQLAKMLNKNISTITRNLEVMENAKLVQVSKTKLKKNLQVKYWKVKPIIFKEPILINLKNNDTLPPQEKEEVVNQLNNFILFSQGIIHNILTRNLEEHEDETNLSMFLLDKKTGQLLNQKLQEFFQKFLEENQPRTINLKNLDLDTFIFFLISSRVKNTVPPK